MAWMDDMKANIENGSATLESIFTDEGSVTGELAVIGKPSKFHKEVDQYDRMGTLIKQKMNIIDIIPCDFDIDLFKASSKSNASEYTGFEGLKPNVTYGAATEKYSENCYFYDLEEVKGIRIYSTDETTISDSIVNQYNPNIAQSFVNSLAEKGRQIRGMGNSVTSKADELAATAATASAATINSLISAATGGDTGAVAKTTGKITEQLARVLIEGKSISLPQVWDSTSYNPNMNCVIKLVSPYGTPKAIEHFIIRPLTHLLLLSMPQTEDGVSYGYPPFVSIKAYGMTNITIGAISNITMRRGGNDTAFNIYKQPLSLDVSIEFKNIVEGCASFNFKNDSGSFDDFEAGQLMRASEKVSDSNIYSTQTTSLFQTPGKIIESLRPHNLSSVTADSLGLTGQFSGEEGMGDPTGLKDEMATWVAQNPGKFAPMAESEFNDINLTDKQKIYRNSMLNVIKTSNVSSNKIVNSIFQQADEIEIVGSFLDEASKGLDYLSDLPTDLLSGLDNLTGGLIGDTTESLGTIFDSLVGETGVLPTPISNAISGITGDLSTSFAGGLSNLTDGLADNLSSGFIDGVVNGFDTNIEDYTNTMINDLTSGLANTLTETASNTIQENFATAAVDSMNSATSAVANEVKETI